MVFQINAEYGARSFINGRANPGEKVTVSFDAGIMLGGQSPVSAGDASLRDAAATTLSRLSGMALTGRFCSPYNHRRRRVWRRRHARRPEPFACWGVSPCALLLAPTPASTPILNAAFACRTPHAARRTPSRAAVGGTFPAVADRYGNWEVEFNGAGVGHGPGTVTITGEEVRARRSRRLPVGGSSGAHARVCVFRCLCRCLSRCPSVCRCLCLCLSLFLSFGLSLAVCLSMSRCFPCSTSLSRFLHLFLSAPPFFTRCLS